MAPETSENQNISVCVVRGPSALMPSLHAHMASASLQIPLLWNLLVARDGKPYPALHDLAPCRKVLMAIAGVGGRQRDTCHSGLSKYFIPQHEPQRI